jgi:AraC-like DNA-binding protein/mannose-6-phosphate isomerase-like protein (cupin superfamily)
MADYYREEVGSSLVDHGVEFFPLSQKKQGLVTRAHIHPAIEFIYVVGGRYEIGVDSETYVAEAGDLLLFRSNAIHTLTHIDEGETEGKYYVIKINPTLLFHIFSEKDDNSFVIPFIHKSPSDVSFIPKKNMPEATLQALEYMIAEYNRSDALFNASERAGCAALLISLLREVIAPRSTSDASEVSEKNLSLIHESVKYINENYASDITPEDCAKSIHLSYSYFAKLFRAVVGKTFKEYLTGVRIAKAHSIIISTDLPITDVAISSGYNNLAYFIAEYKKVYGKTPRESRKERKIFSNGEK